MLLSSEMLTQLSKIAHAEVMLYYAFGKWHSTFEVKSSDLNIKLARTAEDVDVAVQSLWDTVNDSGTKGIKELRLLMIEGSKS